MVRDKHLKDSIGRSVDGVAIVNNIVSRIQSTDSLIKKVTAKNVVYYPDVQAFQPADSSQAAKKTYLLSLYKRRKAWEEISLDSIIRSGQEAMAKAKKDHALYATVNTKDPLASRKEIIGDNPFDINDKNYGNNIVGDEYADHGSHCSCIIAAGRNDGIGIDGIADNVIILPVRAVNTLHYGDEMDKDIALAIRYAVDNGARIISMSFGKDFSPNKPWVDEALGYAEKRGVLLVHAAGNDGKDIDKGYNFPTPYLNNGAKVNNFINVGSMSSDTGAALTAQDSNFGQDRVDLFGPGVAIYSCIPGGKYAVYSGTSMATPAVAGVAALLLEYYPNLTAAQLKDILMRSVTSLKGKMVNKPGTGGKEKVDFATLSVSGGVVNAYKALQLAATMQGN
jgi:subtilisin family serine protease